MKIERVIVIFFVATLALMVGWVVVKAGLLSLPPPVVVAETARAEGAVPFSSNPMSRPGLAAGQGWPDFAAIVEASKGAVVNIMASGSDKAAEGFFPLPDSDPFSEFFRRFQMPRPQEPRQQMGSGFIVSQEGLVLTNAHVVSGATSITVKLSDRREFTAKLLGADIQTDIAVLKIEARNLSAARLGDSKTARVGEWVLAIGSPYGFENTVTAGIISATSRALPESNYVPFIQTDAAVNPGNSGGPLINMKGEVIGINSQIYSRTGGYQGLSFAIPIEVVSKVQAQIVKTGKVERGRIGVAIQEVTQALAESFGLDKPEGALVSSVEKNGPAGAAGVEPGDVILSVNGTKITRSAELPPLIADLKPGATARLEIWRKGEKQEITVKVAELKPERAARTPEDAPQGRLGVAVRLLTSEERRLAEVDGGVLVEQASGAAAKAGIQEGDIILAANGTPVRDAARLRALVARAGKRIALLVQRGNTKLFVPVELG